MIDCDKTTIDIDCLTCPHCYDDDEAIYCDKD